MPTTLVHGTKINWKLQGEGKPRLVLVHGSWSTLRSWDQLLEYLSPDFRVLRYDRRGYGESDDRIAGGSLDDDVEELAELIEALDFGPAHIAGYSRGGTVALRLASSRPTLIRSLIVHEPALQGILSEHTVPLDILSEMREVVRSGSLINEGKAEEGTKLFFDTRSGLPPWHDIPAESREALLRRAPAFADEERDPTSRTVDRDRLRGFDKPLLITRGDNGSELHRLISDRIASVVANSRMVVIPGAGHAPHRSHPEVYSRIIGSFIREVDSG